MWRETPRKGQRETLDCWCRGPSQPPGCSEAGPILGVIPVEARGAGPLHSHADQSLATVGLAWGSVNLGEMALLNGQFLERTGLSLQLPTFPVAGRTSTYALKGHQGVWVLFQHRNDKNI